MAFPWDFAGDLVGSGFNLLSTLFTNRTNERLTRETNANNRQMQREANETNIKIANEANALQREESEKAYRRSMPVNQVANMQAAGMSKAGALSAINGGGSYQPAAVNVAQVQSSTDQSPIYAAPQLDVGALVNAIHADRQLKEQKRQFNANLGLERDKLQLEKDKLQETANQNAALRNMWHDEVEYNKAKKRQLDIRNDIDAALRDGTISAGKAESLARLAEAQLRDVKAKAAKFGYDALSPAQIKIISEYQASLEVMANFGSMSAQKIIEYLHDIIDSLPFM